MSISGISSAPVQSTALDTAESALQAAGSASGVDFSALLQQTLEQQYTQEIIQTTGQTDLSGGLSGLSGGMGMESLILAAASSGQMDDAQLAVFMLLMMMQSETSQSGDMGPLMSLMATMIGQLDTAGQKKVYQNTMDSDYSRDDLMSLEDAVFSGIPATQAVTRTGVNALVPTSAWKAATPAVTGDETSRSPQALREIIDQFEVETSERYRPFRNGSTYCNIFLWDVTTALGCEIPHYIDSATGEARSYPDISGAWEMNANATADWLADKGAEQGWVEVSARQAQAWANEGRPAVTAWKNLSGGSGHVQVVCPSQNGGYDEIRGVSVAQAGATVTGYTHISSTFKQSDLKAVRYYIHQ